MEHRAFKLVDAVCHHNVNDNYNEIEEHEKELAKVRQDIKHVTKQLVTSPENKTELERQLEKLKRLEINLNKDLHEKERMSTYSVIVGVEEFELLTMKLLTLAKDALVYLSLAIHHEESQQNQGNIAIPCPIPKK